MRPWKRTALLLALLLSFSRSHAQWTSTLTNQAILSPVQSIVPVVSECDCKALCSEDNSCMAISYDAVGDTCTISEGTQSSLRTQNQLETVTYTKFSYTPPAPILFMSAQITSNFSRTLLTEMCAAENGFPFIIRTVDQREEAKHLVWTTGYRITLNEITPYLDGGLVYGTAKGWADALRTFSNGSLAPHGLLAWHDQVLLCL
ncbi:uncharacterized protein LOC108674361 [Hyalella azteca]|uniref:Uncharacterized protein LOC108674361 n=1 Tax=Hyalella azteca TaxID=294128 RepID=A0A8B7NVL3_HYAAZ|nr:uncharacterized protein LOC108674361 [Hyalella azteca]